MELTHALLLVGLAAAVLDSRTTLLAARGGMAGAMATRPLLIVLLGGFSLPAQIAILIGGFFAFTWYYWFGAIIAGLFGLALLVTPKSFPAFYHVSPILNLTAIVCAALFWADFFELIEL